MSNTAYSLAQEAYAEQGVDPEAALQTLARTPLSLHCWQGDDVRGFEAGAGEPGGGLAVTGAYPGRARTPDELRADLDQALALLPGRHRVNLHASYAELGGAKVDRDAYEIAHFRGWVEWAKARGLGLDFNPTFFGHLLAQSGLTLTHPDEGVRRFWIAHGIACRRIAAEMGRQLGSATITNVWIPDGSKDLPVDRRGPRERLAQSLDTLFAEAIDPALAIDAVESKLFGLGSEAYVVGSHEFYLGYAITRQKHLCLDAGHFHPTESIADKISSVLQFVPGLLLHVSRGVRWDSDHVVIQDEATRAICEELVRGEYLGRTRLGLDYFDASINRVAAWVIGARAALKALLAALLEPAVQLRELEAAGDFTARLALLEEARTLPLGAIWDEHCRRHNVPGRMGWLREVQRYEREVLTRRN
ncbi:MAG: L-rhamnose isomerase [Chthoniobacter sp.]|uniref:L-rhamnose isomerase n=1 Tax=Chthoniobacter sp. TaxID=2510640 RepID=UPI0032A42C3C